MNNPLKVTVDYEAEVGTVVFYGHQALVTLEFKGDYGKENTQLYVNLTTAECEALNGLFLAATLRNIQEEPKKIGVKRPFWKFWGDWK